MICNPVCKINISINQNLNVQVNYVKT